MIEQQPHQRLIEATFEVKVATKSDAEIIFNAVKAELADEGRESISIDVRDESLMMNIVSEDVVKLRAVLNTWLRILNVASEMIDLKREVVSGEERLENCERSREL